MPASPNCVAANKIADVRRVTQHACVTDAVQKKTTSGRDATVLVVDDEEPMRHMLGLVLDKAGYKKHLAASAHEALEALKAHSEIALVLCDVRMPDQDGRWLLDRVAELGLPVAIVMMSAYVDQDVAVDCLRKGARDYISKPFKPDEVLHKLQQAFDWLHLQSEHRHLLAENEALKERDRDRGLGKMLGQSPKMREVFALLSKIAAYKTTVLILGESGTGKELVARLLHDQSPRASGPFVPINCGAIPENLLESELFGHVKGAFTDANRNKVGLVEEANGGTLFLDEIGDLPTPLQVKLLRFLQEEEIRRVGDTKGIKVDVRVVAATAKDLPAMAQAGSFREDLYYRLNVVTLRIPPLRDRKEDVALLADHFLLKYRERLGRNIRGFHEESRRMLLAYHWPGNVRELENAIEQAMVLADGDEIDLASLPERIVHHMPVPRAMADGIVGPDELSIKKATELVERTLIKRALERTSGNRTKAAQLLEISHRALLYKLKEYGIS